MDAHLSADQRQVQVHQRAAVAVNPLASSLHGPSSPDQASKSAQPSVSILCAQPGGRTHEHTRTNAQRNERTPACPRGAAFGESVLESLGAYQTLFLASGKARQGRAISHLLITHQSTFSVALTDNNPQAVGLDRDSALQQQQQRVVPGAEGAPALWPRVGSLATCSRTGEGIFWPCLGIWHRVKISTRHTRKTRPPATSKRPTRKLLLTCWCMRQTSGARPPSTIMPPSHLLTWKGAPVNVPRPLLEGVWKAPSRNWGQGHTRHEHATVVRAGHPWVPLRRIFWSDVRTCDDASPGPALTRLRQDLVTPGDDVAGHPGSLGG